MPQAINSLSTIPGLRQIIESNNSYEFFITFFSEIEVLGHNLYTYGSIYLIILSIILLLAMLATIVLSKENKTI